MVANLFCNLNLLKNSQEMLRNDWLACMMARMIISASSFASAWKVINYQECPAQLFFFNSTSYHLYLLFFYHQVCTFTCWSGLRPAFIPRISSMIFSASTLGKINDNKKRNLKRYLFQFLLSPCPLVRTLPHASSKASCKKVMITILPFCQ